MANYTKIDINTASSLLKLYAIENIELITPMTSGISNTNYKVTLKDADPVLLKISNDKSFEKLKEEQEILFKLEDAGFTKSLTPKLTVNNEWVYQHQDYIGVLYPFIEGRLPKINKTEIAQIGAAMGELHSCSTKNIHTIGHMRRVDELGFDFGSILEYVNSDDCLAPFKDQFIDLIQEKDVELYLTNDLPEGVIHGDMYYDNCLMNESGEVLAVLDFEQAGIGEYLFDIGICISGSCLVDGKISRELIHAFLEGYEKHRELTHIEEQLLEFSIIIGLFSIALWRIARFNTGKIDSGKKDNYIELINRAKDFYESK